MSRIEIKGGERESPAGGRSVLTAAPASGACFALDPGEMSRYRGFTFPTYQSWLVAPVAADILATGLQVEGHPAGLALGRCDPNGQATLASIYVTPACRGQGLAGPLLRQWTAQARGAGAKRLKATWRSGQPTTGCLEALLARAGWSAPETRMLLVEATLESIAPAPWMQPSSIPAGLCITDWHQVPLQDRQALLAGQARDPWIPADLLPFDHERDCDPRTSLALYWRGELAGWVITHGLGTVLRFTCAYIHPRLQHLGRIVLLYREVVARMPAAGFASGIWTIPLWHPRNANFARRWMAPYATRFDETRGASLVLAGD